ncbi:NAP-domain-containing protein [Jaminaea rosea]|uniref:NAP-domain-containing protein n=1 Tax=Jaminaea rosea TaxID=1569628 RepID=A0A316UZC3_9BASI|nr:NAP-domain-containing protein [Jaminaea rosea]PWN28515.1 NAP-domain-containing protein [Jaminaea rosea]
MWTGWLTSIHLFSFTLIFFRAVRNRNSDMVAPTPQNTPLSNAPLTREALSRPTVGTIGEEDEGADVASALSSNPALAGLMQDKLNSLVGRSSGYIESLPDHIKRRVEGLKGLQVEHTKIETEFQKEILELEKKYATKYAPIYQRRSEIVNGKAEPTRDEVVKGEESEPQEESDDEDDEPVKKQSYADTEVPADAKNEGIPEFWLTALKNHVALSELIEERDEEALKALTDVRMSYLTDASGFKLEFVFDTAKNDFFTDSILTKTYYYQDGVGYSGDLVYDHAEGCEIHWKEGKDLTHKVETKKQRNKNTNQTRTVKRSVPTSSVFNFFNPPRPPKDGDDEDVDLDEIDERLELDYQIGEDLKDRIIPRAVDYFSGKALAYEDLDDDDFEDEDDEDDDDEDDEDEEDDGRQRRSLGAGSQMAGSQDPQECKHQ